MALRLLLDPCDFGTADAPFEAQDRVLYGGTMPTAIVSVYTAEGFVIAADGFGGGADGLSAQKVFSLRDGASYPASYAISGWAGMHDEEANRHISFDDERRRVAESLDMSGFVDLNMYGETFARMVGVRIQRKVGEARNKGLITEDEYATEISNKDRFCVLHFNGYFRGVPSMVAWTVLFHQESVSVQQYYHRNLVIPDDRNFYGSGPILDLLMTKTNGGFIEKYKTLGFQNLIARRGVSLEEAVEAATSYIDACSQPEARAIDPRKCLTIGGRIHIATIMPNEGFAWVPGREPASYTPES